MKHPLSGIGLRLVGIVLAGGTAVVQAGPIYSLGSQRYFGDPNGRVTGFVDTLLTGSTNDEHVVNYNDGNVYDGRSAMQGAPLLMETSTSVSINQAVVTDNAVGFLARDRVTLRDSVLVTGGSGTAYLLPLVRVSGIFVDNSAPLFGQLNACFGTTGCNLLGVAGGTSTGGVQNVDTVWIPAFVNPAAYEFTFGAPITTFMFFGTNIIAGGGQGVTVPGGESASADFSYQLLGYKVVDGNGNDVPGVTINSGALSLPEPGTGTLGGLGLAALAAGARRWSKRGA